MFIAITLVKLDEDTKRTQTNHYLPLIRLLSHLKSNFFSKGLIQVKYPSIYWDQARIWWYIIREEEELLAIHSNKSMLRSMWKDSWRFTWIGSWSPIFSRTLRAQQWNGTMERLSYPSTKPIILHQNHIIKPRRVISNNQTISQFKSEKARKRLSSRLMCLDQVSGTW